LPFTRKAPALSRSCYRATTSTVYTSEATGIESVTVTCERPIALELQMSGLVASAFDPSGSVVTLTEGSNVTLAFDLVAAQQSGAIDTRVDPRRA
jgi:hypothetical protein